MRTRSCVYNTREEDRSSRRALDSNCSDSIDGYKLFILTYIVQRFLYLGPSTSYGLDVI